MVVAKVCNQRLTQYYFTHHVGPEPCLEPFCLSQSSPSPLPLPRQEVVISTPAERVIPPSLLAPPSTSILSRRPQISLANINSRWSRDRQIEALRSNFDVAYQARTDALDRLEASEMHCQLMLQENSLLRTQLSAQKNKTQRRTLKVGESHMTGERALQLYAQQASKNRVKEDAHAAKLAAQQSKLERTQERRATLAQQGMAVRFDKSFSNLRKDDYEDILLTLGLPIDPT